MDGVRGDIAACSGWKLVYFWSAECSCVRACEKYSFRPLGERYRGKATSYAVVSGKYDLSLSNERF